MYSCTIGAARDLEIVQKFARFEFVAPHTGTDGDLAALQSFFTEFHDVSSLAPVVLSSLEILFGEFQGCEKVASATGPLSSVKNDTATEAAECYQWQK